MVTTTTTMQVDAVKEVIVVARAKKSCAEISAQILSLTLITLVVCGIYMTVFQY
jgi:hypothetical protein